MVVPQVPTLIHHDPEARLTVKGKCDGGKHRKLQGFCNANADNGYIDVLQHHRRRSLNGLVSLSPWCRIPENHLDPI